MVTSNEGWVETTTGPEEYQREQPILDRLEDVEYGLGKLRDKIKFLSDMLYPVRGVEEVVGLIKQQDLRGLSPIEIRLAEMQEFIDTEITVVEGIIKTVRL